MLGHKVFKGAAWLVGARLTTRGLDLLGMLIVARILTPADFGLVAVASTVLTILNAVSDLSLSNALIQMRNPPPTTYDTAFTLGLFRGLLLTVILVVSAWPLAQIYHDKRLIPIVMVLSVAPLTRGLISPRMADFARKLKFQQAFLVEAAGKAFAFAASVSFAIFVRNYWALIAGMVVTAIASSMISYIAAPYRPRLSYAHWDSIVSFSGWLTLSQAVNTLNMQADRFFIGGKLGTATLGQYSVGSDLASLPTEATVVPMTQALFAGFAELKDNIPRFRAAYLASQSMVMALAVPMGFLASMLAYPVIVLTVGPKWGEAAFVIMILAPVISLQILTTAAHAVCMATGQTGLIFKRDLIGFCIRLPLIFAGIYWNGFQGVVLARVVSGIALIYLNMQLMNKILGITTFQQLLSPWRSLISAALMVLSVLVFRKVVSAPVTYQYLLLHTAACAVLGGSTYVISHLLLWISSGKPPGAELKLTEFAISAFSVVKFR